MDVLDGDLLDYLYIIKALIIKIDRRKDSNPKQGESNGILIKTYIILFYST